MMAPSMAGGTVGHTVRSAGTGSDACRAQVVVIDVTGVPTIDPEVAAQLVETVAACGLLGARVILTGLSSETTEALVASGVDLKGIHAVADLQRAIEEAQRLL